MSPESEAAKKTVLVADDDVSVMMSITGYLQRQGYSTLGATTGDEVMEALKKERPDLVVLDISMPGPSGIVLTREIRALPDPGLRAVPIVILTAQTDRRHEAYSNAAGANAFVRKPVTLEDLTSKIAELLPD